jgi:hypothetical protein
MPSTVSKPSSVDELSALFDEIQVGSNLEKTSDYGASSVFETPRPFSDKVADVRAIMEPEPPLENKSPEPVVEAEVQKEPELESVIEAVIEAEPEVKIESEPEPEPEPQPLRSYQSKIIDAVENGDYVKAQDLQDKKNNPLSLTGQDFRAYELISQKYPQFKLSGEHVYNEFYCYKVRSLKYLLTRHGLLPIADMKKEIENIQLDKRLGDLADPVVIGQRMDDSIAYRGRVASLLSKAQGQLPAWKKSFEWLNSKVQKDHDLKGAHKRDGLALEHNADMKDYYCELQGFVDSATTIDNFLKSQHDSYSRQLSCVDIREKVGVMQDTVASEIREATEPPSTPPPSPVVPEMTHAPTDSELDGFDVLESGTLIEKVPVGGLVEKDFPGAEIESGFLDGVG